MRAIVIISQPLVSIGIPTYNRPRGLSRTLACISNQTYSNVEIIVSDNCSPNSRVTKVVEKFMKNDNRISYFRQSVSLGMTGNFKFVLEKAKGVYFMWAADDDEWDNDFIQKCLNVLQKGNAISVMSHFDVLYRFDNRRELGHVPALSINNTMTKNALAFLTCVTPSLFYGLHKRDSITFFLNDDFYDFYDCYFMLKLILTGSVEVIEPTLYAAGIDTPSYQVKPAKKLGLLRLQYSPLLFNGIRQIFLSAIRTHEKIVVSFKLVYLVTSLFFFHEIRRMFK